MKTPLKALLASVLLAVGGFGATVYAINENKPQDSKHQPSDPAYEQCVRSAVVAVYPEAKGGFVPAAEREPSYREFGDKLHYRERGLQEVHSVVVDQINWGKVVPGAKDEKVTGVTVRTRTAPIVLPRGLSGRFEETKQAGGTLAKGNENPDDTSTESKLVDAVLKCGVFK